MNALYHLILFQKPMIWRQRFCEIWVALQVSQAVSVLILLLGTLGITGNLLSIYVFARYTYARC